MFKASQTISSGRLFHVAAWVVLALWVLCPRPAPAQQAVNSGDGSSADSNQRELGFLRNSLYGEMFPVEHRRDAAVLILQQWPQAWNDIVIVLGNTQDPGGQTAAARALAEVLPGLDPLPEQFIKPLIGALSAKDEKLSLYCGHALASYGTIVLPELERLILEPGPDVVESARMAAVVAVERIKQKKSAEILIRALDDQNVQLSARCRFGLENLTGISFGDDNGAWQLWWRKYKDKDQAEWLRLYIDALKNQNRQLVGENAATRGELRRQIQARWQGSNNKPELLKELLANILADVRSRVLILAQELPREALDEQLKEKIRSMVVSDSSAEVRSLATDFLRDLRDKPAAKIFLTRLSSETDPVVRSHLAQALGYVGGAETVQPLIDRLADPSPVVAGEAAAALGNLASAGSLVSLRPAIVTALLDSYENVLPDNGGAVKLRSKLLLAMVGVGSPSFREIFLAALGDESAQTRADAVEGLRRLPLDGNRKVTLAAIRPLLADEDRGVRLGVLAAMKELADVDELPNLENRLDASVETDAGVRKEVWRVIAGLLGKADFHTMQIWGQKSVVDGDVERREQVLSIMESKLTEMPGSEALLIDVRKTLGDTYGQMDRWQSAARKYEQAYVLTGPDSPAKLREELALNLLEALLRQEAFDQAGKHLAVISSEHSQLLQQQALVQTLSYLEDRFQQAENSKKLDRVLIMISGLENSELPGLSSGPMAARLTALKTDALAQRKALDREMILLNVGIIAEAVSGPEATAQARADIVGLGLSRSGPILLTELDTLLDSGNSGRANRARERVLVELLARLDERFSGYDIGADLDIRRSVLSNWTKLLQDS